MNNYKPISPELLDGLIVPEQISIKFDYESNSFSLDTVFLDTWYVNQINNEVLSRKTVINTSLMAYYHYFIKGLYEKYYGCIMDDITFNNMTDDMTMFNNDRKLHRKYTDIDLVLHHAGIRYCFDIDTENRYKITEYLIQKENEKGRPLTMAEKDFYYQSYINEI